MREYLEQAPQSISPQNIIVPNLIFIQRLRRIDESLSPPWFEGIDSKFEVL